MKQWTLRLVLPLTIISFAIFTKWWYALVVDGPDEILFGFPLPFICRGWHTSLSLQIFMLEFLIDFATYFAIWFILLFLIYRRWKEVQLPKILTMTLAGLALVIVLMASFFTFNRDNKFALKRPFDMELMETGYKFIWQNQYRPDYYKYHPERKQ